MDGAIRNNDVATVKQLLDAGTSVNTMGKSGTALKCAAQAGNKEVVQLLLDRGASISYAPGETGTPLKAAAEAGHAEVVQLLLDRGASINAAPGPPGRPTTRTALQAAARAGNKEMVRLLLDRGADVNATTGSSPTALEVAKQTGNDAIIQLLLDRGGRVYTETRYSVETYLSKSSRGPSEPTSYNVEPTSCDIEPTSNDIEPTSNDIGPTRYNIEPISSYSSTAPVSYSTKLSATTTHRYGGPDLSPNTSVIWEDETMVKKYLEEGGDPNGTTNSSGPVYSNPPLVATARAGNTAIVDLLLHHGADIDLEHPMYGPPVIAAAFVGHTDLAIMLLNRGADISEAETWWNRCIAENHSRGFVAPSSDLPPFLKMWQDAARSLEYDSVSDLAETYDWDYLRFQSVVWQWEVPAVIEAKALSGDFCSDNEVVVVTKYLQSVTSTNPWNYLLAMTFGEWLSDYAEGIDQNFVTAFLKHIGTQMHETKLGGSSASVNAFVVPEWEPFVSLSMTFDKNSVTADIGRTLRLDQLRGILKVMECLCKALRPPSTDDCLNISSARYRLERYEIPKLGNDDAASTVRSYGLRPAMALKSAPLPEVPHRCWQKLFGYCNIVESSKLMLERVWGEELQSEDVEPHDFGRGLEMSFGLMVSLAAVEFPVTVRGGVAFVGYDTTLVPTAINSRGDAAQFHLITRGDSDRDDGGGGGQLNPHKTDLGPRLLTTDEQQFYSMRCFLGWCASVQINLGTRDLPAFVNYSGGRETPRSMALEGYDTLLQLSAGGPLSGLLGLQAKFKYTSHRRQFTPFGGYCGLLRCAAEDLAVVYDATQHRGWLVPKLSLLLHMSHAYSLRFVSEAADKVPFVNEHADALELVEVLDPVGEQQVFGNDVNAGGGNPLAPGATDHVLLFRQLLLGLNTNLLSTVDATQPSAGHYLHAFEFMDVVMAPGRGACMKSLDVSDAGRAWLDIVNTADAVVVCADIGSVITPTTAGGLCNLRCGIVPCGLGYLAATVPCLARLARRSGGELRLARPVSNGNENPILNNNRNAAGATLRPLSCRVKVSSDSFWDLCGNPFGACLHEESSAENCWQRDDLLQRLETVSLLKKALEKAFPMRGTVECSVGNSVQTIPPSGAVVFGRLKRG